MATTLTQAGVEKLKPLGGGKRRWVRDAGAIGLYLVVMPTGVKSWAMQFRQPGREGVAKLHLGPVDISRRPPSDTPTIGQPLTLIEARRLAAQVNSDRVKGIDIISETKAAKHRRRVLAVESASNSFAAACRDFVLEHARPKTRNWEETCRILGLDPETLEPKANGLADRWSDRDVKAIDAGDLFAVIEEARRHGIPGMDARADGPTESRARKLHAALSILFSWAQRRRRIVTNPMLDLHAPTMPRARDRVLSAGEMKAIWVATDALKEPFGSVIKMLMLSGARLNEVAQLRWDELAEDQSSVTISADRVKNHLPFVLPLAPLARSIIADQPREGRFVFTTNHLVPVSVGSKIKNQLDEAMGFSDWRFHDIRRSVATHMASIGVAPHVIESVLNHVSGFRSGVAGTYNRFSYINEKREALERWADHLQAMVR